MWKTVEPSNFVDNLSKLYEALEIILRTAHHTNICMKKRTIKGKVSVARIHVPQFQQMNYKSWTLLVQADIPILE